ncbi:MAG: hypothetical protein L6R38_007846 [Xanthoria sp. 2 TBL-2021]|nr:MAG: hypothetical protein L6R38_007846 [Xanthoria sp. 2 TBL-2021]
MSVDERRSEASILIITSAGGKAFQNLHPNLQVYGIPIWPNDPHPLNNSLVCLKNEWALPKECYINTIRQYTIPSCILKPLFDQKNGHHFHLRDDSFAFIESRSQNSSRSPSPGSIRSSSPASSISSDSSNGRVRLSPFLSPATSRPLIRYSATELLALRPGSNLSSDIIPGHRTPDFDLLSPSHRCGAEQKASSPITSPSSSPEPATPTKRPLDESPATSPPSSTPAWRSSRTPSVSTPDQQPRYIDAQDIDSYFPTASNATVHESSYVDAEELDSHFPLSAQCSTADQSVSERRQLAPELGCCMMRCGCHTSPNWSSPLPPAPPPSHAFSHPFSSTTPALRLPIYYSTLQHTPFFKIDIMTTSKHYSSTTYAVTTYLITTYFATGVTVKKVLNTSCHWTKGF